MILTWLPAANATRFAQLDYIAQHNAKAAISMDNLIEEQTAQLEQNPNMGRLGRKQGTRELVISGTPFICSLSRQAKIGANRVYARAAYLAAVALTTEHRNEN